MGTFKLQMKQGLEGQIRAQRQGDFVDKPHYSGKFPSQVPNYKGHNKSIVQQNHLQNPENLEWPESREPFRISHGCAKYYGNPL